MSRQSTQLRRSLAAAAGTILVVLAVAGCNRGGNATPQASQSAASAASAMDTSSASGLADETQSATASASDSSATASTSVPPTSAPPATPDAVASQLDQIQRLINDIDSSLSSSDGGE